MFLHLMSADTKETFVFHNWQWWKGNMEEKKSSMLEIQTVTTATYKPFCFLNLSLFQSLCSAPSQEPVMRYEKIIGRLTLQLLLSQNNSENKTTTTKMFASFKPKARLNVMLTHKSIVTTLIRVTTLNFYSTNK